MRIGPAPMPSSFKQIKLLRTPRTSIILACGVPKTRPTLLRTIAICNQHEGNSYPAHGASFAPADYHTQVEGRSVWECSHTHNPGGEHLALLLPQLCTYWPSFLEGEGIQLPNFNDFIEQAYREITSAARPGVAAWRFPLHSLASNTLKLLLSLFSTSGILIEGFGAGTSFSAVAGLVALSRSQFI